MGVRFAIAAVLVIALVLAGCVENGSYRDWLGDSSVNDSGAVHAENETVSNTTPLAPSNESVPNYMNSSRDSQNSSWTSSEGSSTPANLIENPVSPACIVVQDAISFDGNCSRFNGDASVATVVGGYCVVLRESNPLNTTIMSVSVVDGIPTIAFDWAAYLANLSNFYVWPALEIYSSEATEFNITNSCATVLPVFCSLNSSLHYLGRAAGMNTPGVPDDVNCTLVLATSGAKAQVVFDYAIVAKSLKSVYTGTNESCIDIKLAHAFDFAFNISREYCLGIQFVYGRFDYSGQYNRLAVEDGWLTWTTNLTAMRDYDFFPVSEQRFYLYANKTPSNLANITVQCSNDTTRKEFFIGQTNFSNSEFVGQLIPRPEQLSNQSHASFDDCRLEIIGANGLTVFEFKYNEIG